MNLLTNILRDLRTLCSRHRPGPSTAEASPRDVALLLEQATQCAERAKAALTCAEMGDYGPMEALELTAATAALRDVAASAADGSQVLMKRRRAMDRQLSQIRDLPEAGDR